MCFHLCMKLIFSFLPSRLHKNHHIRFCFNGMCTTKITIKIESLSIKKKKNKELD